MPTYIISPVVWKYLSQASHGVRDWEGMEYADYVSSVLNLTPEQHRELSQIPENRVHRFWQKYNFDVTYEWRE